MQTPTRKWTNSIQLSSSRVHWVEWPAFLSVCIYSRQLSGLGCSGTWKLKYYNIRSYKQEVCFLTNIVTKPHSFVEFSRAIQGWTLDTANKPYISKPMVPCVRVESMAVRQACKKNQMCLIPMQNRLLSHTHLMIEVQQSKIKYHPGVDSLW